MIVCGTHLQKIRRLFEQEAMKKLARQLEEEDFGVLPFNLIKSRIEFI